MQDEQFLPPFYPFTMNHTSQQANGLLLWCPMALVGGDRVWDFSPYGRHGAGSSIIWRGSVNAPTLGAAVAFDGTTDWVDFGNASWLPTSEISVVLWQRKVDTTWRASSAFGVDDVTSNTRCGAHVPYDDGTVYWDFGGATAGATRVSVADTATTFTTFWVFTVGPRGMEIWKSANLIASNGATPTRSSSANSFTLGRHATVPACDLVDTAEFRIYNRQLGAAEIYGLFDMKTRYDLYYPLGRRSYFIPQAAGTTFRPQIIVAC